MAAGSGLQPVDLDSSEPGDLADITAATAGSSGAGGWRVSCFCAAVSEGGAVGAGDGQAPAAAGGGGDGCGEVAAGGGVQWSVPGGFAGLPGQAEPGRQGHCQVHGSGQPGEEAGTAAGWPRP